MKRVFLIFLILVVFKGFSQTKPQFNYERVINDAHYIFEGEVIDTIYYNGLTGNKDDVLEYDVNGNVVNPMKVLTAHKIRITKVIRGNLNNGTVELIIEGGFYWSNNSPLRESSYMINGFRPLPVGAKGFFFCNESEFISSSLKVDNVVLLAPVEIVGLFTDGTDDLYGFGRTFFSKKEFYQFLAKYPNITIPKDSTETIQKK